METTMKITECSTETQWICEISGHSYVRTRIRPATEMKSGSETFSWHLNEDQQEDETYLKDEKLEELFWLDKSNCIPWKDNKIDENKITDLKTPSALQIGDDAELNFYESGIIELCKIEGVYFTKGKVRYDVAIPVSVVKYDSDEIAELHYTTIKNVDSAFVASMF